MPDVPSIGELPMNPARYEFSLFADYFQFYLQDDSPGVGTENPWTEQATNDMLAVAHGYVIVGTARNMTVPVALEVYDSDPGYIPEEWDHVTECSMEVRSGKIVVAGCTDYFPDATRIQVGPGPYAIRVLYGDLDKLSWSGLEGEDHYLVMMWPGRPTPPRVVKRRPPSSKGRGP